MLDWTSILLTLTAMAIDLIILFLLYYITKRTRGGFRVSLIWLSVAVVILFIKRFLNLLNLSNILTVQYLEDSIIILIASSLFLCVFNLFKEIRNLTDVELHHTREARRERNYPEPRREPGEAFERQRERVEEKDVKVDGDGKRRLRIVNGYVDFTDE